LGNGKPQNKVYDLWYTKGTMDIHVLYKYGLSGRLSANLIHGREMETKTNEKILSRTLGNVTLSVPCKWDS